jgi:phosphatidylserine decarboxylase
LVRSVVSIDFFIFQVHFVLCFAVWSIRFYRKLASGARIVSAGNPIIVSPADSRVLVFPNIARDASVWLKNSQLSVSQLLGGDSSAQQFMDGSMVIARLALSDYHRMHSPVSGLISSQYFVSGTVYSVSADAIRSQNGALYNERRISVIKSTTNSSRAVAFVAVGATCTGSIIWTNTTGSTIDKGSELGYFAFGGSTVVLLFPPGSVQFDDDLIVASSQNVETLMKVGNSIGTWT